MYIFIGKEIENLLVNTIKNVDDYTLYFRQKTVICLGIQEKYDLTPVSNMGSLSVVKVAVTTQNQSKHFQI